MAWLFEVPMAGVVSGVLAQLRWGAPYALVPLTLLPVRLLGFLQQLAPDWVTPWLPCPRVMVISQPCCSEAKANGAPAKKDAAATAGRKKE